MPFLLILSLAFTALLPLRERSRPAAVLRDHGGGLRHQPDGLGEGDDDLLAMGEVVLGKGGADAVMGEAGSRSGRNIGGIHGTFRQFVAK